MQLKNATHAQPTGAALRVRPFALQLQVPLVHRVTAINCYRCDKNEEMDLLAHSSRLQFSSFTIHAKRMQSITLAHLHSPARANVGGHALDGIRKIDVIDVICVAA
jgi:hypothetical protein